jgi:feruloyl esterase
MDPDNPDLGAFASRGGKLIVYHGWADNMVPAKTSIDFWQSVNSKMGDSHVSDFYRLFMIPGMSHCGDGPGANILFHSEDAITVPLEPERDMLSALEQWVEESHAPSKFLASRVNEGGIVERTRLVCPYPSQAKYRGQGNVEQADNFTCAKP